MLVAKGGLRAQAEVTGPGSDVTRSALNRKSRDLNGKTADQVEKGIVGSGWGQTAEKRGLKVQSPIGASGVVPGLQKKKKKKDAMLENKK